MGQADTGGRHGFAAGTDCGFRRNVDTAFLMTQTLTNYVIDMLRNFVVSPRGLSEDEAGVLDL
jgi:hypothetical protein